MTTQMRPEMASPMPPAEVFAVAGVLREWACTVDRRFTTFDGALFCGNPDHERAVFNHGRFPMSDLVIWISEHWTCVERTAQLDHQLDQVHDDRTYLDDAQPVTQPVLPEPGEPALVRPYMYAAGFPAIGVAQVPDPNAPAFTDPPAPCPITGLVGCAEYRCELHYMDAPLRLDPSDPLNVSYLGKTNAGKADVARRWEEGR